jgi:hypothetical protein
MKHCKKCNTLKLKIEFHKNKSLKDGLYGTCKICTRAINKQYTKNNPDIIKKSSRKSYIKNKDKILLENKKWAENNTEKVKAIKNKWANKHIDQKRSKNRRWKKENPDKVNAQTAKRRAAKLQATPPWISEEHLKEIEKFYTEAKRLEATDGIPREVDHILPLQGDGVSGLHVPWNLQVITEFENRSKHNKY